MRYNLRLLGRTKNGIKCIADITVYARSQKQMQKEAMSAAEDAAWQTAEPPVQPIAEGEQITVENVLSLDRKGR